MQAKIFWLRINEGEKCWLFAGLCEKKVDF